MVGAFLPAGFHPVASIFCAHFYIFEDRFEISLLEFLCHFRGDQIIQVQEIGVNGNIPSHAFPSLKRTFHLKGAFSQFECERLN